MQKIKIVVSGAAGHIGYALLFRIASGQMFGKDTAVELSLLELEHSLPALEGVVMELEDCAFPLLKKITYTSNLKTAMADVNLAILVGAVPRKQGMERSDLLEINGGIFTKQGQALNSYAASDVKIFVVGNPCNTNCLITMHNAKDIPEDRFFAMTTLDELRSRFQLARKANVGVEAVSQMTIWGNHSATQYPDFYTAKINGVSAAAIINDDNWLKNEFIGIIQQRGAAVIKARGSSSAASAANAIIIGIRNIYFDTEKNESFSMALISQGQYNIDPGLIFSFPCRRENGVLKVVDNLPINDYSQQKINATLAELKQEHDIVKKLNLI